MSHTEFAEATESEISLSLGSLRTRAKPTNLTWFGTGGREIKIII